MIQTGDVTPYVSKYSHWNSIWERYFAGMILLVDDNIFKSLPRRTAAAHDLSFISDYFWSVDQEIYLCCYSPWISFVFLRPSWGLVFWSVPTLSHPTMLVLMLVTFLNVVAPLGSLSYFDQFTTLNCAVWDVQEPRQRSTSVIGLLIRLFWLMSISAYWQYVALMLVYFCWTLCNK